MRLNRKDSKFEAIRLGQLQNGLSYALWPDSRDAVATLQIWVSVGSRDEAHGKTGLAHMLEHLMFRGSATVPDGEFDRRMESLGAQVNAATWLDYTYYTTTVHAAALPEVLELEADRFAHLLITQEVFRAEREVVSNERRQVVESDPESMMMERFYREIYGESCYGWPTIGWSDDIAGYRAEDAQAFHQEAYAPGRLFVSIAGAVDPSQTLALLERTLGSLTPRASVRPQREVALSESFCRTMTLPVAAPRVNLAWPTEGRRAPSFAVWCLLHDLLSGGDSALLPAALEVNEKLVLDINASQYDHALPSLFEISATLRQGVGPERIRQAVDAVLTKLAASGPTEDDMVVAKTRLRAQDALSLAGTYARAEDLGESWIAFGDPLAGLRLRDEIVAVTAAEIRGLAHRMLHELPRYELVVLPTGSDEEA